MFLFAGVVMSVLAAAVLLKVWMHDQVRKTCRAGAKQIYGELTAVFDGEHIFRITQRTDFPDLNEFEYARIEAFAREQGFHFLGALEDLTVSRANPANHTRIDCYVSADGTTGLATFHLKEMQFYEFCTLLEGARFITTSNAEPNKLAPPAPIVRKILPQITPPEQVLAAHQKAVQEYRAANPKTEIVLQRTFEDALSIARATSEIISTHRRSIGYLTEGELRAIGSGESKEEVLKVVWQEFSKLREEGNRAA